MCHIPHSTISSHLISSHLISSHLIHSSSHSLIWSLSFSHAPSACHSFISLIVSSFASLTLSKIFLFVKLFYCGVNSSQQQTGSISLYLSLFLVSSISSSLRFVPGLFIDQYPYCPSAQRCLRVIKEALE